LSMREGNSANFRVYFRICVDETFHPGKNS
jgi:hypothetical protein